MRILAHRGASGYAPENTFASFELALKMQADALESDVRMTKDGVLVLIHDDKVDRTTTGVGLVSELLWEEMRELDAGVKYRAEFAGERVPRVEEFLGRFEGRIPVCLEVKTPAVVEPLVKMVRDGFASLDGGLEFTSFEWEIVVRLHEMLPGKRVGALVRGFDGELIEKVKGAGLSGICPPAKAVTPELVAEAHRAGLTVRTWGAHTREALQHLLACGVDGTTLNHPDWICREGGVCRVAAENGHR